MKVVCIKSFGPKAKYYSFSQQKVLDIIDSVDVPVKGEIYTVVDEVEIDGKGIYYALQEFRPDQLFASSHFREIDTNFGNSIAESIEQQINIETHELV